MRTESRIRGSLVMLIGCVLASSGAAREPQPPPRPEAQIAALERLAYMAGVWTGQGWIDAGGRRLTFRGTETVQRKLDGTVLLVEGNFVARPDGADADIPVHTTLGVISFDPRNKKYRFTTWLASGSSGERELLLDADGWRWEIESPRGVVRYTMRLTPSGEWLEVGERSADRTTWQPFFEMRLRPPSR